MGQPRAQASDARCFGCFSGHGLRTHPLVRVKGYLMAKRPNRLPVIGHEQQQIELLKKMTPNETPEEYRALSNGLADVSIAALELVAALEGSRRPNFEVLYDLVDGLADLVGGSDTEDANEPISQVAAVTNEPVRGTSLVAESAVQPINDGASSKRPVAGVSQMKTTIIGRPDRIETEKDTITLYMSYTPRPNANGQYSFPKGVPTPASSATPVVAYVGRKQFEKVKLALDNPEDSLIVEGGTTQVIDGVLTVYAINITTRLQQLAKKMGVTSAEQTAPPEQAKSAVE